MLELAGSLHDVGKQMISEQIIEKPGPLTDAEWEEMRKHPELGEEYVREEGHPDDVGDWVRHHHERLDGTGYPDHLEGEEIPMGARIIAVLDAYVGMTSPRALPAADPGRGGARGARARRRQALRPAGGGRLRAARAREPVVKLERARAPDHHLPPVPAPRRVARAGRAREAGRVRRRGVLGPAGARLRRSRGERLRPRPRARGARRQPHRPRLHGRPVGRLAVRLAPPDRVREPADVAARGRRPGAARRVRRGRGPVRAAREPAAARPSATTACRTRRRSSS